MSESKAPLPGRKCAICGKPGGSGLTLILRALGYGTDESGILYAHGACVIAERKRREREKKKRKAEK